MRFYIAGNYVRRSWLAENVVPKLEALGHINTARWVTAPNDYLESLSSRDNAWLDRYDIDGCHAIAVELLGDNTMAQNGKHFELGYAQAAGKEVYLIGTRFHIFHHFGNEKSFKDWTAFFDYVQHSPKP
jgi:hypothetical protein